MNHAETALAVLRYLHSKQNYTFSMNTSRILTGIDEKTTNRPRVLEVLHRLAEANLVQKQGDGNFKWRLNRQYDEVDDFPWTIDDTNALFVDRKVRDAKKPSVSVNSDELLKLQALVGQLASEVADLRNRTPRTIEIKNLVTMKTKTLDGPLPAMFPHMLDLARARKNIMLVGPAGCGKTTISAKLAEALDLPFACLPGSGGTNESHLLGRSVPNMQTGRSEYQQSKFVELFQEGGVFLLDEMDGTDPNLLLCLNSALANGYLSIPNLDGGRMIKKHKDFVMVTTANTFGKGADRVYAGRNQLDDATLDRFRIGLIECDYDPSVEVAVCPDADLRRALQTIRLKIEQASLRRVMSTRFLADAYDMKSFGWDLTKIVDTFTSGWTKEEKAKVL